MKELFSIEGKVALVTGGASGIGEMIATGFVEAGARVYVASRKADALDRVAARLSRSGSCTPIVADLASEDACRALAADLADREDALHVLVNNAGATWGAPLEEYPDAAWDKLWALNVKAVFALTRACAPLLRAATRPGDPARVINVGSVDGIQVPALETYAYSASKAAVHQLTRVLARKLAPEITVNAIAPGPFQSRMMRATLDAAGDAIARSVPLRRIGEPEDMAGVAIFLASRAGAWITGDVIPVDGGIVTTK
ncbi:MAG: SDR family oxidoreductase [Myxococcota bacterium]|nr:SDR family oxidoreductase [Myxococcales bacterium]